MLQNQINIENFNEKEVSTKRTCCLCGCSLLKQVKPKFMICTSCGFEQPFEDNRKEITKLC